MRPMTTLWEKLGFKKNATGAAAKAGTSSLGRELAERLSIEDPQRLNYLAAFGGLLGRVAMADATVSEEEVGRIESILHTVSNLSAEEAAWMAQLVGRKAKELAGIENHLYLREINEQADKAQKLEIVSCLFAVAAADDEISPEENEEVRRISSALLLDHRDFIEIRRLYRDKLSVLKNLPK